MWWVSGRKDTTPCGTLFPLGEYGAGTMQVAVWFALAGASLALAVSLATWRGLRVALTRLSQTEPARVVTEVARLGGVVSDLAGADDRNRAQLEDSLRADHSKLAEGILGFEKGLSALKYETENALAEHLARSVAARTEVEIVLTAVEDVLELTEKKRGSMAAYESRRKKAEREAQEQEQEKQPDQPVNAMTASLEQLRQIARGRGIEVM